MGELNYKQKVMSAYEAAELIHDGMTIAFGGQVACGYPKLLPKALSELHKDDGFKINVLTTSNNSVIDGLLSSSNLIHRRAPMIDNKVAAIQANNESIIYCEQQMNKMPRWINSGVFGDIDYYVLEAVDITDDGRIYFSSGLGLVQTFIENASKIIIELNESQPKFLKQIQDCFVVDWKKPIPLTDVSERIGENGLRVPFEKIEAIVLSKELDDTSVIKEIPLNHKLIAKNLFDFLSGEMRRQNWKKLPPIQTGFGNLANSIVREFNNSDFTNIRFFAGHLQDANIELLINGKADFATASSIQINKDNIEYIISNSDILVKKLLLRNSELINNSEIVNRIAPISLNSCIEVDIYGNVNSSHISGNRVLNGLGGAANFAENAGLSIVLLPSSGKSDSISTIVPSVAHQDICEHDVDVVVTDCGVADLRGKSDRERAKLIIENCANSVFKERLIEYFEKSCELGGHHPVNLEDMHSWHVHLKKNKRMV